MLQIHLILCRGLEKDAVPIQEKSNIKIFLGVLGILKKIRDFEILIDEHLKTFRNQHFATVAWKTNAQKIILFDNKTTEVLQSLG